MKTKIKILQHEDKTSKGDHPVDYSRFKCEYSDGSSKWMSVFDKDLSNELKANENRVISVEVTEKGDFLNIKKFYGIVQEGDLVNNSVQQVVEENIPKKFSDDKPSFYVSYVKDLVVAGKTLEEAIEIIKQAREAFS